MRFIAIPEDGPLLESEADATELVGSAYGADADVIAIPLRRLAPDFWQLSNRKAGLFIQKLTNYRLRPAFVGDLSADIARSSALRDYVRECNKRQDVLFVESLAALERLP